MPPACMARSSVLTAGSISPTAATASTSTRKTDGTTKVSALASGAYDRTAQASNGSLEADSTTPSKSRSPPSGETIGTMTYFKDPENGERDALLHFVEGGVYPKTYPQVMGEFKRTGDLMPVMTKFARIAPSGLARYRSDIFGARVPKQSLHSAVQSASRAASRRTSRRRHLPHRRLGLPHVNRSRLPSDRRARRRRWKPARARYRRVVHSRMSHLACSQTRDQRRHLPHPKIGCAPSAGSSRQQARSRVFTDRRRCQTHRRHQARRTRSRNRVPGASRRSRRPRAGVAARFVKTRRGARSRRLCAISHQHTRSPRRSSCSPQRFRASAFA